MSVIPSPLKASQMFRPVRGIDWPIYRQDNVEYATFYAPGYLCVVDLADADRFESTLQSSKAEPSPRTGFLEYGLDCTVELWRHAEGAVAGAVRLWDDPFQPECLTLYMNNECNLDCVYCYTAPSFRPATRLELETIVAAAEVVAEHCRHKGRPLYVVFHGGGEPALHCERVDQATERLEQVALRHDVELFRYMATNGAMSEDKAHWMAHRFDLVGLSCDGPPDIQNRQRPLWGGRASSKVVERSGHILREEGCPYQVRVTITRSTLHRQVEIADYICQQFSPEEMHFEPVYIGGRTTDADVFDIHHAEAFVDHFCRAREVAKEYGIPLTTSGSRAGSIHGPYCHIFRSVLNLVPDGVATVCFKITEAAKVVERGAAVGALDRKTGCFQINHSHIQELRHQLSAYLLGCVDCFNRYHCVRECPDFCPLDGDTPQIDGIRQGNNTWQPGFRCYVQKMLTCATLRETAERLWVSAHKARGEWRQVNTGEYTGRIIRGTRIL